MENKYLPADAHVDSSIEVESINSNTQVNPGYVLIFMHPLTQQCVLLARNADISAICYTDKPYLPGTANPAYAKFYESLDELKSDVYLLRYHHRGFLHVKMLAKPAVRICSGPPMQDLLHNTTTYYLNDLEYIEN